MSKDKEESAIEFGVGRGGWFVRGWGEVGTVIVSLIAPLPGGLIVSLATDIPGVDYLYQHDGLMVGCGLRGIPMASTVARPVDGRASPVTRVDRQHKIRMAELRQPHEERMAGIKVEQSKVDSW